MAKINIFITAIILFFISTGCEKEILTPADMEPSLAASFGPERPDIPCGTPDFQTVVDDQGNTLGTAELVNDNRFLYIIVNLNHDWVAESGSAWAGRSNRLPLLRTGDLDLEKFEHKLSTSRPANAFTLKIPLDDLPACYEITYMMDIVKIDLFGNTLDDKSVWLGGNPAGNGFSYSYCNDICSLILGGGPSI